MQFLYNIYIYKLYISYVIFFLCVAFKLKILDFYASDQGTMLCVYIQSDKVSDDVMEMRAVQGTHGERLWCFLLSALFILKCQVIELQYMTTTNEKQYYQLIYYHAALLPRLLFSVYTGSLFSIKMNKNNTKL